MGSQSAAVLRKASSEAGTDAFPSQRFAAAIRIIATIAEHHSREYARMSDFASHIRDGIHDVEDFRDVGNVRAGDRHRYGNGCTNVIAAERIAAESGRDILPHPDDPRAIVPPHILHFRTAGCLRRIWA